ncbi:MAG: DMT family transporter [Gemmatimonadales bacterium]
MRPRELIAFIFLAATWGASFVFIRVAAPSFGAFGVAATRVLIAAAVLWIYARVRNEKAELLPYWRRLLVLGLINAAAPFALVSAAELQLSASKSAVLLAATPLFSFGMLAVAGIERPSTARLIGLLVGVVGVAVLVGWQPGETSNLLASGAVLLGALFYAAAGLYARHRMPDVPVLSLALGQQVSAALWLALPALFTLPGAVPPVNAIASVLALALASTAVAYLVFFWLIREIGALRTATVTYAVPIFGVLWGATLLHEAVSADVLLGLGLILVSMVMVTRKAASVPSPIAHRSSVLPPKLTGHSDRVAMSHCRES